MSASMSPFAFQGDRIAMPAPVERNGRVETLIVGGRVRGLALRAFRKDAESAAHRVIARHHPLIDRYRRQPAAELIREIGLGSLHDEYARLAYHATCFADPLEGNALVYLNALFPVILPMWV